MRYRTQAVAYPYFVVAMLLYGLQMAFGLLAAAKYLGPIRSGTGCRSTSSKAIHTNLLIVWVLTGVHGRRLLARARRVANRAAQPEDRLRRARRCGRSMGVTTIVGYVFGWTAGNKLLEQP